MFSNLLSGKLKIVFSTLFGIVVMGILLWFVDISSLLNQLSSADPMWILAAVLTNFMFFVLRSLRWKILLKPLKNETGLKNLFSITILGNFANTIIPLRIGEFVRGFVLNLKESISFASGFLSIVVERVLDLLAIVFIAAVSVLALPSTQNYPQWFLGTIFTFCVLTGTLLFVLFGSSRIQNVLTKTLGKLLLKIPKLGEDRRGKVLTFTVNIFEGTKTLHKHSKGGIVTIFFLSILTWLCFSTSLFCLFKAFNVSILPTAIVLGTMLVTLSTFLPAAPGYVGSYEAFWVLVFMGLGLSAEFALPVGLLSHAMQLILTVVLGSLCLGWAGLSLGDFMKIKPQTDAQMS